ncbi:hypothetical protein EOE18_14320 [Novosphingobium umbonatum]|uniref:Uncharacterized protein n=1 Tax=Novosphingobium umbonatum TaxID=1908524 RepID=A0A3S3TLE7_9SPHN|nr:hypothetical protein [Novosphingobium umbonatum]RVU03747.1 hypothetical protein EOE18_14320 [Novosphingobium umbonatum]
MVFLVALAVILILCQCGGAFFVKRRYPDIPRSKLMFAGALVVPALLLLLLVFGFVEDALLNDDPLDDAPQRSMLMLAMVSPVISLIFAPSGAIVGRLLHRLGQPGADNLPETPE